MAAIALNIAGVVPLSISFLAAALVVAFVNKYTPQKAYNQVDWRLLILIGGMSAFGVAMENGCVEISGRLHRGPAPAHGSISMLAGFVVLHHYFDPTHVQCRCRIGGAARSVTSSRAASAQSAAVCHCNHARGVCLTDHAFEPSCILVYGPGKIPFQGLYEDRFTFDTDAGRNYCAAGAGHLEDVVALSMLDI